MIDISIQGDVSRVSKLCGKKNLNCYNWHSSVIVTSSQVLDRRSGYDVQ